VLVVSSSAARGQDGAKALNIFQQLLVRPGAAPVPPGTVPTTPGVPGVPGVSGLPAGQAAPAGAAGLLGNSLAGSSASSAATGNQAMDLISLLTQSTETIDEAREIEIGRQLAAVLLGSKPLYPDMALQRYVNQLGRWISLQSTRPDLAWTFAVIFASWILCTQKVHFSITPRIRTVTLGFFCIWSDSGIPLSLMRVHL
jgi:hypothetical protein